MYTQPRATVRTNSDGITVIYEGVIGSQTPFRLVAPSAC